MNIFKGLMTCIVFTAVLYANEEDVGWYLCVASNAEKDQQVIKNEEIHGIVLTEARVDKNITNAVPSFGSGSHFFLLVHGSVKDVVEYTNRVTKKVGYKKVYFSTIECVGVQDLQLGVKLQKTQLLRLDSPDLEADQAELVGINCSVGIVILADENQYKILMKYFPHKDPILAPRLQK